MCCIIQSLAMDKSWMNLRDRLCKEYVNGIRTFIQVAKNHVNKDGKSRCPCRDCQNAFWKSINDIEIHLYRFGIATTYQRWIFHGEKVDINYYKPVDLNSGIDKVDHLDDDDDGNHDDNNDDLVDTSQSRYVRRFYLQ